MCEGPHGRRDLTFNAAYFLILLTTFPPTCTLRAAHGMAYACGTLSLLTFMVIGGRNNRDGLVFGMAARGFGAGRFSALRVRRSGGRFF